ncbi:MAG: SRPBCC domain-containing protein [Actinomycetota bacterium]|nr:SRPBCC domain-containing protein [Actinomycetota bacterium]
MTPDSVRLTRTIQAPPEEVYRAWTEPDRLRRWFGPDGFEVLEVELEARPGGRYRTAVTGPGGLRGSFEGEFRELVPGQRIVATWSWVADPAVAGAEPEVSLLTVTLAEAAQGTTELTLVHDRVGPAEDPREVEQGWEEALGKLASASAGRPSPEDGRKRLEALIGRWRTEGQTVAGPSEAVVRIYDAASGTYPTHAFDSQGAATTYQLRERDGTWTISGENERSTLVPAADGVTMLASWERSDDGRTWRPWMEIRLARVAGEGG